MSESVRMETTPDTFEELVNWFNSMPYRVLNVILYNPLQLSNDKDGIRTRYVTAIVCGKAEYDVAGRITDWQVVRDNKFIGRGAKGDIAVALQNCKRNYERGYPNIVPRDYEDDEGDSIW